MCELMLIIVSEQQTGAVDFLVEDESIILLEAYLGLPSFIQSLSSSIFYYTPWLLMKRKLLGVLVKIEVCY